MARFISKTEGKRLLKKLQMKYGADLAAITEEAKQDMEVYGYIRIDTELKRQAIIEKIKDEEKHYL